MKAILIGLAVLPLMSWSASAATRLTDLQLDRVTAGLDLKLPTINCGGCTLASSTSSTNNGATTTTGSTVPSIIVGGGPGNVVVQLPGLGTTLAALLNSFPIGWRAFFVP